MEDPIIYNVQRLEPTVVGYKGQIAEDAGYFFAPYWPGMSAEDRERVDAKFAERSKGPTELQQLIMKKVQGQE